ncbi:MAG: hypothetical protein MUF62_01495 [Chitinophagaceae bacterium]|nr:hypothetical protein [Chitinophagaceae bacterium]
MKRLLATIGIYFIASATFLSAQPHSVKLGNTLIQWLQFCSHPSPGISWVHVHENETTSVAATRALIDSLGKGCLVSWRHSPDSLQPQRYDPNRIYTPEGLKKTLQANGAYSKPGFTAAQRVARQFISKYVDGNRLVVALHNNSDGGGLHIKSYLPGGEYANDAAEVFVNEAEDIDDFFYTTDRRIFDFLKARGFNILLQNNASVTNDGSLSVYCGYQQMAYLNIEAQQGHLQEQKRMMLAVFDMIETLFK